MTQTATADFIERVSDTRAGADFTDVVEFWPAGADTADWPVMEVRKVHTKRQRASLGRDGFPWRVDCFEDSDLSCNFRTKHKALRHAREVMGK